MTRPRDQKRLFLKPLAVAATFFLAGAVAAQQPERCYTAQVPFAVMLPDGSVHNPGSLKICVQQLSPAMGLHRTSVNGRTIGVFRSHIDSNGESDSLDGAVFVFLRNPRDELMLQGVAAARGDDVHTFRMIAEVKGSERFEVTTDWWLALKTTGEEGKLVAIASYSRGDRR